MDYFWPQSQQIFELEFQFLIPVYGAKFLELATRLNSLTHALSEVQSDF